MKLKAIGTKVFVELNERESASPGGIIIPEKAREVSMDGAVLSFGGDVDIPIKEGTVVGVPKHLGTAMVYEGREFVSIDQSKLLYVREGQ